MATYSGANSVLGAWATFNCVRPEAPAFPLAAGLALAEAAPLAAGLAATAPLAAGLAEAAPPATGLAAAAALAGAEAAGLDAAALGGATLDGGATLPPHAVSRTANASANDDAMPRPEATCFAALSMTCMACD
jgi:hypothetical protein